ncbi:hypothetical protein, partial [Microcoleus sp. herbarium12]|uniref:hypothetical protein n=1 Tax=Microcoleus sp. herbarium12 TaxID=3055437 RepID=UPI002FD0CDED
RTEKVSEISDTFSVRGCWILGFNPMAIKLKKYEQALAILPGCKGLDKLVLYDNLKSLGYCWSTGDRKWSLMR